MTDPQNPLVDAMETYGEEEQLLTMGIRDRKCDYGTQQDILDEESIQEMLLFLGEYHCGLEDCECHW